MARPVMRVQQTKSGTYTMFLQRPGEKPERWRTGVPSEQEALHRAKFVAEQCGYRFDRKVRAA